MTIKSPFVIIEEFISPLMCEEIISRLNHNLPNRNMQNNILKTIKENRLTEIRLLDSIKNIIPSLEEYYNFSYEGLSTFNFEWMPSGYKVDPPQCDNSVLINGKWLRKNNKDFTGIIFLNDYQASTPFDENYEVFGGKLEFAIFGFSILPKRGTLVIFPGEQHFVNTNTQINYGELNQIRFHITSETPWKYDGALFSGDYTKWFAK